MRNAVLVGQITKSSLSHAKQNNLSLQPCFLPAQAWSVKITLFSQNELNNNITDNKRLSLYILANNMYDTIRHFITNRCVYACEYISKAKIAVLLQDTCSRIIFSSEYKKDYQTMARWLSLTTWTPYIKRFLECKAMQISFYMGDKSHQKWGKMFSLVGYWFPDSVSHVCYSRYRSIIDHILNKGVVVEIFCPVMSGLKGR